MKKLRPINAAIKSISQIFYYFQVDIDFHYAFQNITTLLQKNHDSIHANTLLALCYLKGWGCDYNASRAIELAGSSASKCG